MTNERNIEKLIKQFCETRTTERLAENDQRIINDALAAFERTKQNDRFVLSKVLIKIAAVIVVFISGFLIYHIHGNNHSELLNVAVAKIENADTLIYNVKTNSQLPDHAASQTKWTLTKSGYAQIDADNGGFSIILEANKAKGVVVIKQGKKVFAIELPNVKNEPAQIPFLIIDKLKSLSSHKLESIGKREVDNKMTEGFCLSENNCITKIWIDSVSLLPVQLEMQFVNRPDVTIVASDFKINTVVEKPSLDDYEKMPIRLNAEPWMANEFYLNEFMASLTKLKKENDVFQSSETYRGFT